MLKCRAIRRLRNIKCIHFDKSGSGCALADLGQTTEARRVSPTPAGAVMAEKQAVFRMTKQR
ncbi:hypothetical protein Tasa_014_006 [Tanticharoenia sakaeratensis NBRC 103193]|uniref:Uncharacterized protein n=1 Tax=Tanticharoenia sakaeratensis NBRC 103193 TaxID=1231623 RepID=A0A0D6MKL2_9PROT|nr:hypothetical protein Tasa_014_006 [Tanticharoenia sakaeratensis NBRC 103193]GBQ23033.1 hypothetical protein AA103193_2271 [Tanticharoenia sakaeratensis NBRC 103193]